MFTPHRALLFSIDIASRIGESLPVYSDKYVSASHSHTFSDVAFANIMMDGRPLFPQGHHPVRLSYSVDGLYEISAMSRTDHPVRYYYIDFGLSVHFKEGQPHLVLGDVGREDKVPELSVDVPYDPFKVDVFTLGNMYYKEFVSACCSFHRYLCLLDH